MDQPTRRLNDAPAVPTAARPCLRCQTPLVETLVSTRGSSGAALTLYTIHLLHYLRTTFWAGRQYASTTCTAWVCPACGSTELVATNPAALHTP
jgi:hypothetical protein